MSNTNTNTNTYILPDVRRNTMLVIRTNGEMTVVPMRKDYLEQIKRQINTDSLDFVSIGRPFRSDLVMAIDDLGWETEVIDHGSTIELKPTKPRKPINPEATKLYLQICRPGTTHQIVGDVVVLHDNDVETQ